VNHKLKIGICGWGNVATGLFEQLTKSKNESWELVCIGARRDNPNCDPGNITIHRDIFEVINDEIDVLVELIGGTTTAKGLISQALNAGKHVITANKAVIYEHGNELINLAKKNNVHLLFEASVCAGTPVIKMLSNDLGANQVSKISGMLNGTTNYILSNMENGISYDVALDEAKQKGYAEPDPSLDVNGTDAAHKIGILASLALNSNLPASDFYIEGIQNITANDFSYVDEFNLTIKHLAVTKKVGNEIELRSHPVLINKDSSLGGLSGVRNGIQIDTDLLGEFLIAGSGAGKESTASGLISDLLALLKASNSSPMNYPHFNDLPKIKPFENLEFSYYVYLEVQDQAGVLALVSQIFSDNEISIDKIVQKDHLPDSKVPVVVFTDRVKESQMQKALENFSAQSEIHSAKIIRIEA
jgi:homoserine dehydrogenase